MDYKEFLRRLGAAVRAHRVNQKKTQETLADEIGVHQSNLSKIENGLQGFDSPTLYNLGSALRAPLHKIFAEVEGDTGMDRRVELLSDDERLLNHWFRMCNDKGKNILMAIAEMTARANPLGKNVTAFRPAKSVQNSKRRRQQS